MQRDCDDLENALLAAAKMSAAAALPVRTPGIAEAYAIQRRVNASTNMPVMLWKLGLTGAGVRETFGANEPTVGRLPASAICSDRSEIPFVGAEMFAEAELVFQMGSDLPLQSRPYTREDICAALKGIYGGIEIVRTRFVTSDLTLPLLIADNSMAHGLVLGRNLSSHWDNRFVEMPVTLVRSDGQAIDGSTAHVMGNPLDAVVWLANWLREHEGYALRREQLIASGTCTGATEIFANDVIRASFDGAEAARVSVRAPEQKE